MTIGRRNSIPTVPQMAEEQYTRCPSCRTVFRVTPQQLEMREGQVRCGHCRSVFDGVAELVALAPRPETDDDPDLYDEMALGPPTVTLRSAHALAPVADETADAADGAADVAVWAEAPAASSVPAGVGEAGAGARTPDAIMPPRRSPPATGGVLTATVPRGGRRLAPFAYALAIPVLVLALFGQAAFHFRDAIAARWPAARPALSRMCAEVACTVGAPHEIADLVIQASDLQADPAHQGLLILTATLRNRGPIALAYPYLELSLTDAQDQVVVRRAIAPADYVGGTTDLAQGIPANGEVAVKLFIDASATTQAGYRLYLFYG